MHGTFIKIRETDNSSEKLVTAGRHSPEDVAKNFIYWYIKLPGVLLRIAASHVFVGSFHNEYKVNLTGRSSLSARSTTEIICIRIVWQICLNWEFEEAGNISGFRTLGVFPFSVNTFTLRQSLIRACKKILYHKTQISVAFKTNAMWHVIANIWIHNINFFIYLCLI